MTRPGTFLLTVDTYLRGHTTLFSIHLHTLVLRLVKAAKLHILPH